MSFNVFLLVLLSVGMHATWNFLSKKSMPSAAFFCISSFAAGLCWAWAIPAVGFPSAALSGYALKLWGLSLCFETCYFIGLFKAYAAADMSLAYPVARALPVLLIAAVTALIPPFRHPGAWGLTGLLIVFAGCLLMPLKKFRDFNFRSYLSPAMGYILLAAVGTTGYTLVDSKLMHLMESSEGHNAMSAAYIFSFVVNTGLGISMALLVIFRKKEHPVFKEFFSSRKNFITPVCAGILSSLAYLLILIAMPQVTHLSFLQAFRQMSLPFGLLLGIVILKEPAHPPKLLGISAIVTGLVIIAFFGGKKAAVPPPEPPKQYKKSILAGEKNMKENITADIRKMEQNYFKLLCENYFEPETAAQEWRSLEANGSWANIDYQNQTRSGWVVARHILRMKRMCVLWAAEKSPYFHNVELGNAIKKAHAFWFAADRRCVNWWYNEIYVPRILGYIAICGKELFSAEEMALIRNRVSEATCGMTGQNRIWRAEAVLLAGILENNSTKINRASKEMSAELQFSCEEGIRVDGCFHQHGKQIQFGNYGMSYLESISEAIYIFAGTRWQFPDKKLDAIRHFAINGMKWVLWKDVMDLQTQGRQLWQDSQSTKYSNIAQSLQRLAAADSKYKDDYLTPPVGNKMFYTSDLMIQRTKNYYLSIRGNSVRTMPVEVVVNFDNLLGQYFSDGCMLLMRSGREYYNLPGCWDWTRLPGTTAPATPRYTAKESEKHGFKLYDQYPQYTHTRTPRHSGTTQFTGGVSNGETGAMIYTMDLDDVQAKKAYFCSKDLIVALGCGIDSDSPYPVATTVEQSVLRGEIKSGKNWYFHNGIGYYGKNMTLFSGKRKGDWKPVFGAIIEPRPYEMEVFQLTIDHGIGVKNGAYCYAVIPDGDEAATANAAEKFTILANDRSVQAVRFTGDGSVMAVFHREGKLEIPAADGKTKLFTTNAPGIFIISDDCVYAADPTQTRRSMTISWQGKKRLVLLPRAPHTGKSVEVKFK